VFQGILVDVTPQKRIEHDLRTTERRLRTVIEQMPAIVYIEEPSRPDTTQFLYVSPQVEDVLGYSPDELIADPDHLVKMLHPDDREAVIAANAASEETGSFDMEYRLIARDGRTVWIHSLATLVAGEPGEPAFWQGVALDVTARHEAEAVLRDFEGRHGSDGALETSPEP
jgi:PAS domain S-box-containing protein